jgi:hypothetical protein
MILRYTGTLETLLQSSLWNTVSYYYSAVLPCHRNGLLLYCHAANTEIKEKSYTASKLKP